MLIRSATVSAFAALFVATAAYAAPAPDITVQIAGRSAAQIRQDINAAATQTCAAATESDVFNEYDSQEGCEESTIAAAYRKLASAGTEDSQLAMVLPASAR